MVENAVKWLNAPVTDKADIAHLNALCAEFNVKPLPVYIRADMANLNAVKANLERCLDCKASRDNCYKYSVYVQNGRIKAAKTLCNSNRAREFIYNSGIPEIYSELRLDKDFRVDEKNFAAFNVVGQSLKTGKGFFIFGAVGTGKTMLCSLYAVERAFRGKTSLFYTVTDMFADLRDFDNPVVRAEKERKIKYCPCLIIDDLGAEYVTDWVSSKLFDVLDTRYKNNLTTVINSNLAIGDINSRYTGIHGSRIARRISELCTLTDIGFMSGGV